MHRNPRVALLGDEQEDQVHQVFQVDGREVLDPRILVDLVEVVPSDRQTDRVVAVVRNAVEDVDPRLLGVDAHGRGSLPNVLARTPLEPADEVQESLGRVDFVRVVGHAARVGPDLVRGQQALDALDVREGWCLVAGLLDHLQRLDVVVVRPADDVLRCSDHVESLCWTVYLWVKFTQQQKLFRKFPP